MSTDQLTPAGSATYSSGTMFVGDGTWDSSSNTFLLPNLQGLNYDTMRYNGMGARFANLPGYYTLILGHGVLAAITFLFLVPFAIMVNRFHWQSPYWRIRLHIWAQVLTVFLTTVIFVLGWFSVGPERSLTNPHHSIGLTLYVLVLVQFIGGYLNYKSGKRRAWVYKPLRVVLHHWLGRVIGLLGIAQVALGLTVYGSPLSLFIIYAVAVAILVLAYFVLDFMRSRAMEDGGDAQSSYVTGTMAQTDEKPRRRFGLGETLLAGGALGALASRFRNRRRPSGSISGSEEYSEYQSQAQSTRPSRRPGTSHISEKHSEHDEHGAQINEPQKHTWRNRLLGLGALGGLGWLFSRRNRGRQDGHDYDSMYYTDYYSQTSGGGSLSRVEAAEEGRPQTPRTPIRPTTATAATPNSQERLTRPGHGRTASSVSYESSYVSGSPSKYRPRPGVREGLLGLGFLGAAKGMFDFKKRRERKEQKRLEEIRRQETEDEVLQRRRSKRTTGGDRRPGRRASFASTVQTSAAPGSVFPSIGPSVIPSAAPGGASTVGSLPMPGPPRHTAPPATVMSGAIPPSTTSLAPLPPAHNPIVGTSPYGSQPSTALPLHSEGHTSAADTTAAGLAGVAGGAALGAAAGRHSRDESRSRRDNSQVRRDEQSPATPVSVKLNMHSDGRHVTLRRLTEEEAAKERESKRTRNRSRRARVASANGSGMSDVESGRRQWTEQQDSSSRLARPAYTSGPPVATPPLSHAPPPHSEAGPSTAPPPPPAAGQVAPTTPYTQPHGILSNQSLIPPGSVSTIQGQRRPSQSPAGILSHPGSTMSPPNIPESQGSQMSNYEENRRRRRAERARQRAGQRVDFE